MRFGGEEQEGRVDQSNLVGLERMGDPFRGDGNIKGNFENANY